MSASAALLRIAGSRSRTIAAVVERAPHDGPDRHLVVIAPAFGYTIRRSLVIARYLLAQSFDVLRFDATNHVGRSDGEIGDFTLGSALEDMVDVVRFGRAELAPSTVSLVATSLGGRVAFRAGAVLGGELASLASIASVVNLGETVAAVTGRRWLDGEASEASAVVLEHEINAGFVTDALAGGWASLEGTLEDLATARAPVLDVHGESDPWVATDDVVRVAGACPRFELAVLRGAVHELNAATGQVALRLVTRHLLAHAAGKHVPLEAIAAPSWSEIVQQNKRERAWETSPIETWALCSKGAGR